MPVETAADRLVYFNVNEFGEVVTKGSDTFNGILFDDTDEELEIEGTNSVLICRTDDVTTYSVVRGDTLTIGGVSFKVRENKPDGTGVTELVLEEQ